MRLQVVVQHNTLNTAVSLGLIDGLHYLVALIDKIIKAVVKIVFQVLRQVLQFGEFGGI